MKLNTKDLDTLCKQAVNAATGAGQIILNHFKKVSGVSYKKSGSSEASQIVTEADYESEAFILSALEKSIADYDLGLLSEESSDNDSRHQKDYFWCIDPLDGTLPFSRGISGFAVSIALVSRQGKPVIGVIYDPLQQNLYYSISGQGAYQNHRLFRLPDDSKSKFSLFIDDSFFKLSDANQRLQNYNRLLQKSNYPALNLNHNSAGAVSKAISVLENPPAVYLKPPRPEPGGGSIWDFAATAALFNELNAAAKDCSGQPLELNPEESVFMNHSGVLFASNHGILSLMLGSSFS